MIEATATKVVNFCINYDEAKYQKVLNRIHLGCKVAMGVWVTLGVVVVTLLAVSLISMFM